MDFKEQGAQSVKDPRHGARARRKRTGNPTHPSSGGSERQRQHEPIRQQQPPREGDETAGEYPAGCAAADERSEHEDADEKF
jgi:hypothetical protein